GMTPIDWRTPSDSLITSNPLISAVPAVGCSSVTSMRISVDLPAPLGPSRPKISPSSTAKLMPSTAVKSPNFLRMLRTSIAFIGSSGPAEAGPYVRGGRLKAGPYVRGGRLQPAYATGNSTYIV